MLEIAAIIILTSVISLTMFSMGIVVEKYNIKINYTRKIIHFSWFFLPTIIFQILFISDITKQIIMSIISFSLVLFLCSSLFRKYIKFSRLCFLSIDRPEDRPKTLFWLVSQTFAGYFVLAFFFIIFQYYEVPVLLLYLTILAVTIGDGLAEPVGVKFGKHHYPVKAFFDTRQYYRTYEGSATIFIISFMICFLFYKYFTSKAFVSILLIYPLLLTLVEAKSPHTWDTPLLFFFGNICIMTIYLFQV